MKMPDTWAPLLVSSVRDAVLYHEQLLKSETLRDRHEYEEHLLQLTQFLEYVKEECRDIEEDVGIPLNKLL